MNTPESCIYSTAEEWRDAGEDSTPADDAPTQGDLRELEDWHRAEVARLRAAAFKAWAS